MTGSAPSATLAVLPASRADFVFLVRAVVHEAERQVPLGGFVEAIGRWVVDQGPDWPGESKAGWKCSAGECGNRHQ